MSAENRNFPLINDTVPDFECKTTQGRMILPKHYAGKWIILFSYPANFTPLSACEFISFQQKADQFELGNCQLIGLSIDKVFSHIKWLEWLKEKFDTDITFPIIADETGRISKQFGMLYEHQGANVVRAVYIIDPNGVLRSMLFYPQEVGRSLDEIVRVLKALEISLDNNVLIPPNWPENSLLGDKVIAYPPEDVATARKRIELGKTGNIDCYDWWFCFKKLQQI